MSLTDRLHIVSGGQTGPDRAALNVAIDRGMRVSGWCPAGRWAEDGPIPARYPLVETPGADPAERTRRNVLDSDATLILSPPPLRGGTALTHQTALHLGRPTLVVDPSRESTDAAASWMREAFPEGGILNIAGPRESESPGIQAVSATWLERLFDRLESPP